MGVVYEARHVEIGRRAAIKIVAASLAEDPAAVQDFRAEASASAKIGAPNIADVFDFAVLDDGRLMMAMEFVPGRSLRDIHLADGCLPPGRLIGLFRQVCKGLAAAHEAGLVHRDIKPENIMIGEIAGRQDTVKLVDFGIATILGERAVRDAGTPCYMPPECMNAEAIDGRYDIYSVGCVMYEMLTGNPPYVDTSVAAVLHRHMFDPVPALVSEDPTVPHKLVEVIQRCLAKLPEDRYESMAELEAALCEAQIEGKLRTSWDDLPMPAIDPDRQAKLQAKMPTRVAVRGVSGWWLPVLLAFGVAVGGATTRPLLAAVPTFSTFSAASEIEAAVIRVHESAALAYYVYPPVDDPQADTAYRVLIQLEALDSDEAAEAASLLRAELASTLVRLGDETWSKSGGEPFALDFYIQAILFDPMIEPARTLVGMSPGELLALRRKANTGDFSDAELIAVEPLQALAEPTLAGQQAKLEVIRTLRGAQRRASATAQLDMLFVIEPATSGRSNSDVVSDSDVISVSAVAPGSAKTQVRKGPADSLVAEAEVARTGARLWAAKKLYLRALELEPQRVDALEGLGRVYFEQGKYAKAATYYELAVQRSGRDAELRIALGDAYFAKRDYAQALEQYEQAKQHGSRVKAKIRIARVEQRTGG